MGEPNPAPARRPGLTLQEILDRQEELADRIAAYDPDPADFRDPAQYRELREAAHRQLEEGERLREPVPEGMGTPRRLHKTPGTPVAIRLQEYLIDEIKEVADELDIPASTLMRGWIMAGLRRHQDSGEGTVAAALDRLSADVDSLRALLGPSHHRSTE